MTGCRRVLLVLATSSSLLGLPGCNDDPAPTNPTPTATPTPAAVRGVLVATGFSGFSPDIYAAIPLPLSQRGILDITMDWTFPSSSIYVYLASRVCGYEELTRRTCPYILVSETSSKPKVLQTGILDPGTYFLVFYNVPRDRRVPGIGSDNTETISFILGLTVGGAASSRSIVQTGEPFFIHP
jgi:hypothetical protein